MHILGKQLRGGKNTFLVQESQGTLVFCIQKSHSTKNFSFVVLDRARLLLESCSERTSRVVGRVFPIGHDRVGEFPPWEWCSAGTRPVRLCGVHPCKYAKLDGISSLT